MCESVCVRECVCVCVCACVRACVRARVRACARARADDSQGRRDSYRVDQYYFFIKIMFIPSATLANCFSSFALGHDGNT